MRGAVVVIVLGLVACTKPNPNRCCTDQADCDAHGIPVGTSCAQGLVCRGNQCIAEVCMTSADCDLAAPFCVSSSCSETCTADDQCPGNGGDPAKVHCEGGACVACRAGGSDCPMTAPVCDMGTCRACAADVDCSSGACDVDTGACVDEATIVYASPTGSATATCAKADPCSLTHALTVVDALRVNLKLLPGTYTVDPTFNGTFALNVYGPATVPSFANISDGGTLRIRDLDVLHFTQCSARTNVKPRMDLGRVRITAPDFSTIGAAISVSVCDVTASDVSISGTGAGAAIYIASPSTSGSLVSLERVSVAGGDPAVGMNDMSSLTAVNCIFSNQGMQSGVVYVNNNGANGQTINIQFSTFYNSILKCPSGTTVIGTFANNIFLDNSGTAPASTVTGTMCSHSYDLIKPQATAPTGTNNLLNMDPKFVNPAAGDFHLVMGSPAIDAADPGATLTTDYDGTTRPQGAARDIGAFEYKP